MTISTKTLESGRTSDMHWLHRTHFEVLERDGLVADRVITQLLYLLGTSSSINGGLRNGVQHNKDKHTFELCFMYCDNDYHIHKFGTWEQYVERIQRRIADVIAHTDFNRDTNTTLMQAVYAIALRNGYADAFEGIKEYFLPETQEVYQLTSYGFDFRAVVNYGSEGTWLNCYLQGDFGVPGKNTLTMGTFKTLKDDLEASRIMGELGGVLTYLESRYVNNHIARFDPEPQPR